MAVYRFRLSLSASEYLAYYQGAARDVVVRSHEGPVVQFPADALRRFVTRDGVHGEFVLRVDARNKLQGIDRVGG